MNGAERLGLVHGRIREAASAMDRRFDRLEVSAREEGGVVVLEGFTTAEPMLAGLRSLLAEDGIRADDRAVELLDRRPAFAELVAISAVVHLRDEPDPRSGLLTQAVLGESLDLLAAKGKWVLARTGDGYLGWVRRGGLAEAVEEYRRLRETLPEARVSAREVLLRESPDEEAAPVREAVFDSRLICIERKNSWVRVALADGTAAWVPGDALAEPADRPRYPSVDRILGAARRMIGAPYLWGGTSPKGFDCSGLVHRVFGHFGVLLPRDADRMNVALEASWKGAACEPGDLLFFGEGRPEHVAISLGGQEFLHASGWVRIESLDRGSAVYRGDLAEVFAGAARIPLVGNRPGVWDAE